MISPEPARIHLLPAKAAPVVVVVRRKPSRLYHIIRVNTKNGTYHEGAWFTGRLYAMRCDVSFDGNWFVYLALGAGGRSWNGVSLLPRLTTAAEGEAMGTWNGGGYWSSERVLKLNAWEIAKGRVPFRIEQLRSEHGGEDLGVLYPRMKRDGWQRCGMDWGTDREVHGAGKYTVACDGDDGWCLQPSRRHPTLLARYAGYLRHGYTFRFRIAEVPEFFDDAVDWATYDCLGQLVYSRLGVVTVCKAASRTRLQTKFQFDFEGLKPSKPAPAPQGE